MNVVMEATRASGCFSCVYGIRPGQKIRLNEAEDAWEHVTCPTAPAVCPECFTEVARNGACLCGAV